MIAEALVPVSFVMFLGYLAGARRIIDNQRLASLSVLLLTFVLPIALFDGLDQTSLSGLEENAKLFLVLYVDGSNSPDFADEMRAGDFIADFGLADLIYVGWKLRAKRCPLWGER